MRTALIDGDIVAYALSSDAETKIDWDGDGNITRIADPDHAIEMIKRRIDKYVKKVDADDVVLCLSDPKRIYFRHEVFPAYKQGRTHGALPVVLLDVKDRLINGEAGVTTVWYQKLEADDVMGIYATRGNETVIITEDKDLEQIPGPHWRPSRDKDVRDISVEQASINFYVQALSGDTTDGVPGCRRVGPVRAKKVIAPYTTDAWRWMSLKQEYVRRGHTEEYALQQARVIRILTDKEFVQQQIMLWEPPTV